MEQKTYWWRVLNISLVGIFLAVVYVLNNQLLFGICDRSYSTDSYQGCLDTAGINIGKPLFFLSIAILLVSIPLFFVRDEVFLKWLKLSSVWWFFSIILIALTPSSYHSFLNLNPDRESVSLWLSGLFVIVSLAKLIWDTRKPRQNTSQR
jgi:hypothetical protein